MVISNRRHIECSNLTKARWACVIYICNHEKNKTTCPPGYHHNGFTATHALGHMMYDYILLVPMNQIMLNKLSKECE